MYKRQTWGWADQAAAAVGDTNLTNLGQANYAAANAHLDALACSHRLCGMLGSSLQIPAVSGNGMGARTFDDEQLEAMGAISLDLFAALLSTTLAPMCAAVESTQTPLRAAMLVGASIPVLSELRHESSTVKATIVGRATPDAGSALVQSLAQLAPSQHPLHVETLVLRVVRELTGAPAASLAAETPLMEAGVDSLAATELSSRLRSLTGVALSPTLVFEQPTPRAVAAHLLEQAAGNEVAQPQACVPVAGTGTLLAVGGAVGQWPGGCDAVAVRGRLQSACGDALGSVPAARWTLALAVDPQTLTSAQAACVRHGGFVTAAQRFDAHIFGVSPAEAGAMDPQQRRLLELGYAALHGAEQRLSLIHI